MIEVWKDVVGYEGLYKVSNLGEVKSVVYFNHANNVIYPRNRKLKHSINSRGYHRVCLYNKTKGKRRVRVHRLVAEAFIPNPNNLPEVNHIDGDKNNNSVGNLEWCTHQYNMQEACRLGLVIPPKHI